MTQGQWERLSGGEKPSRYGEGFRGQGMPGAVIPSHPVEQVSWEMCHALLLRHGLDLPTDHLWEYACRAGTSTSWATGMEAISLAGHANILDETGAAVVPVWGSPEGFDDRFVIHAPVGNFLPNDFGLFDMHGNVWEWCLSPNGASRRVYRGGCFLSPARLARSAGGSSNAPSFQFDSLGLRAARAIY